jgi:predicted ATPase
LLLERPNLDDRKDPDLLTQTHLEQVNANRPFRELAAFFESIRYLHVVPQLIREPDRSVGLTNDPFGGDFLEQIAKAQERTRLARLKRIRNELRVAVPQLNEIELFRDNRGTPHLRGKYEHWRPRGAWQTEEQFSDGTLRLMGLLWVAMEGGGPLLLEEPEMSLHPEIVRYLPQMFARVQRRTGRQIILSTHSSISYETKELGLTKYCFCDPELRARKFNRQVLLRRLGSYFKRDQHLPTRSCRARALKGLRICRSLRSFKDGEWPRHLGRGGRHRG